MTVCGYAVEWLRSCYRSLWRLSDDSTILSPGQYCFAPPGIGHFPGEQPFGSRNWTTDESPHFPREVGEVLGVRQTWHSGLVANPFPLAQVVGDERLLNNQRPATACAWTFTQEGGASWSLVGHFPTITFENSENCGGNNPLRQFGTATLRFSSADASVLSFTVEGRVERQNAGFDRCILSLDGQELLALEGFGDNLGCTMQDVSGTGSIAVPAGEHVLQLSGDTVDGLYHVDAFFRLSFSLAPDVLADLREFYQGFDVRCYLTPRPTPPPPPLVPDIANRADAGDLADVIRALYDNPAEAVALLQAIMGPSAVVTSVADGPGLVPGSVIGVRDDLTICCITGTTNFFQVATYCCFTATGPVNLGAYATNATWHLAANAIAGRLLAAGSDPNGRIQFVGHSYGGAVAMLLAGDCKRFNPERLIDCLTFGAPKPGDDRLLVFLGQCRNIRYCNTGDPIPSLPPSYVQIFTVLSTLSTVQLFSCRNLLQPTGQLVLAQDGGRTETDASQISLDLLLIVLGCMVLNVPIPFQFPHSIGEYVTRLRALPP